MLAPSGALLTRNSATALPVTRRGRAINTVLHTMLLYAGEGFTGVDLRATGHPALYKLVARFAIMQKKMAGEI